MTFEEFMRQRNGGGGGGGGGNAERSAAPRAMAEPTFTVDAARKYYYSASRDKCLVVYKERSLASEKVATVFPGEELWFLPQLQTQTQAEGSEGSGATEGAAAEQWLQVNLDKYPECGDAVADFMLTTALPRWGWIKVRKDGCAV